MGEFAVSAGTTEKRMYWLQQLQKVRREFSAGGAAAVRQSVNPHQVSILSIDHLTQNLYISPPGGKDTDKQNSSAQLACVCLSLSHLTAIY